MFVIRKLYALTFLSVLELLKRAEDAEAQLREELKVVKKLTKENALKVSNKNMLGVIAMDLLLYVNPTYRMVKLRTFSSNYSRNEKNTGSREV